MDREEYKSRLGTRFTCHSCGVKFYDLTRAVAACPECGTDPATAPLRDIKSILATSKSRRKAAAAEGNSGDLEFESIDDDNVDDDDDDDDKLFDDDDDDDDEEEEDDD